MKSEAPSLRREEWFMSIVVMLMVFGWSTCFAMFGFCALKESGKLLKARRRMALWLDNTLVPAVDSMGKNGLARDTASVR
jgi:hypothetical protein